jgi:hypothetical protein
MLATAAVPIPKHRDDFFTDQPNFCPSLVRGSAFVWHAEGDLPATKAGARHERQ